MPITPYQAKTQLNAMEQAGKIDYITALNVRARLSAIERSNPNRQLPDNYVTGSIYAFGQEHGSSEGGTYTSATGQRITSAQAQQQGIIDRPGYAAEKLSSIGAGASTSQIEARMAVEDAFKSGTITGKEAIELIKRNIEKRPLEIIRTIKAKEDLQQKIDTRTQPFLGRAGLYKGAAERAREAQEAPGQARPERVYVTISGKRVPFVSSAKAAQQRPIAKIEQAIYDKNIEVSNILKYETPEPIRNFIDSIDRRAQLSFKGEKPLNPFAFRNVAEAIYGIEKGAVKGFVEEPLTAGTSLLVGGVLAKGAGVLAARAPILTRGVGAGKVTSKISALNVAGGAMAGYYGADVASRIAAADNRAQEIGKILSTEIIPLAVGARIAQVPILATARNALKTQRTIMKEFAKSEAATSYFGGERKRVTPTKRIESQFANKMDIEVTKASIRNADFRRYMEAPTQRPTRKAPSQILETQAKTPSQDYIKKIETISEAKQESLADVLYEATLEKQIRAGGKGYVSEARLQEARNIDELMVQLAKKQKQLAKIKQQESVIFASGRGGYVLQKPVSVSKSVQSLSQKSKQVSKQIPVLISSQKSLQKEVAVQKTKQVSQQKYVSVAVSVQKQKSEQVQKIKSIFSQTQAPVITQKQKLKTPQIPETKIPIRPKVPQMPIKIKVPTRQPPTRITEKPPRRPPTTKPPRRPPRRKLPPIPPKDFTSKIEDFAKARKKRGKFVWNIKNQIPTLESLIG